MCKHDNALFCRDRNIVDNCIITLVTDTHFKMNVSEHMLYKIFGLFSLKKVGLWRVYARFIVVPKSFLKCLRQDGFTIDRTPTGKCKNKVSNTRRSYN